MFVPEQRVSTGCVVFIHLRMQCLFLHLHGEAGELVLRLNKTLDVWISDQK